MAWPGLVWSVLKGLKMSGAINPTCLWIGLDGIGISSDRSISRSPDGDKNFQTLLSNLFSFGNCLLGSKSSLAHLFKMTELFCLFLEIEMFSPQNLLDFVGFMQMTC